MDRDLRLRHAGRLTAAAALLLAIPALADAGDRVTVDGKTYPVRVIDAESLAPAFDVPGLPPVADAGDAPALRIGGTEDDAEALRVLAAFCGWDPSLTETYGDYGDPVWRDPATDEVVLWTACDG